MGSPATEKDSCSQHEREHALKSFRSRNYALPNEIDSYVHAHKPLDQLPTPQSSCAKHLGSKTFG